MMTFYKRLSLETRFINNRLFLLSLDLFSSYTDKKENTMSNSIIYLDSLNTYFTYLEEGRDMSLYQLSPQFTLLMKMDLRYRWRNEEDPIQQMNYFLAYLNCVIQDKGKKIFQSDFKELTSLCIQGEQRAKALFVRIQKAKIQVVEDE